VLQNGHSLRMVALQSLCQSLLSVVRSSHQGLPGLVIKHILLRCCLALWERPWTLTLDVV